MRIPIVDSAILGYSIHVQSASRSPPPVSAGEKRKADDYDDAEKSTSNKAIRRDGVLSLEFAPEDDEELCKSGDVTLTVLRDHISKYA